MTKRTSAAPQIVLASGSPRRRELVERLGFDAEVIVSEIPEQKREDERPTEYTERLAAAKAKDVAEQIRGDEERPARVLAADTVVVLDDRVLEKPDNRAEAREMLESMSGRWHTVVTSFCWLDRTDETSVVETVETEVRLRELPEALIWRYVETDEPLDKAGAYGIQDFGSLLVRRLRGSYFNVVGLPVCEVIEVLERTGALEIHPLLRADDRVELPRR